MISLPVKGFWFLVGTVEPPLTAISQQQPLFCPDGQSGPYIDSYGNLPMMATSPQGQRPLKRVPEGENKSKTVMKFYPYGVLMINRGNRILILFHFCCCSKHKLSKKKADVANLSRFVLLTF